MCQPPCHFVSNEICMMMSVPRWMLLICSLVVVVTYSSQESLQRYLANRQAVVQKESSHRTGGSLKLNSKELRVNQYLMTVKAKEYAAALQGAPFPPAQHFFKSKNLIEKSEVFQLIQLLPKGAALHLHDISITSLNWVIKNATYKADLYFCVSTDAAGSLQFEFFSVPPTVKESSCAVLWQSVSLARNKQGAAVFDEWLFNKMSMWTDDDPKKVYPNSTAAWQKFESSLGPVYDLVRNIGVFEPYLWQAMTEFIQDNVQYMEIRGLLPPLKTSNGTQLSRNYTMQKYATIFDKFVSAYPGNFSGAKYIFSSKRHVAEEIVKSDVSLALSLRDTYPDHFAGYDLVGREDAGYPLIHFIQELLLPSQLNRSLPYFFHAGETDWEGTSIDENLIDALLLNTSRIGHGYAITKHPVAMAMALSQDTAIEVNPISNQVLGLVDDLRNHPAATLISQGFPVVISSDDPATWNAGQLSYDFYQAFMGLAGEQADLATLKQLAQDSIRYSAMSNSEKKAAMQLWQKKWDSFLDEILSSIK
ncbi:adenosine deaminase 2-like isoform X3 [Patiria miniata]|uniref:adenosine deaminase n=1 Tax=Patiria miniata TaxID=46514 RepID=A0A913ZCM2_PATMI|nr:adenosine deaminase 2-like isoform X3 [Patiria miniata]